MSEINGRNLSAEDMARILADYSGGDRKKLADLGEEIVRRIHRTEQRNIAGMMFTVIEAWSKLHPGSYDLRNEAVVKASKEIIRHFDGYPPPLPYI